MTLDDNAISHIAKIIQMAIITGTDIVDHLRMMKLDTNPNDSLKLILNDEYKEIHDNSISVMVKNSLSRRDEELGLNQAQEVNIDNE
jgi:hypothetical protein